MAEPESILQLGIEAARDGNKEEARSLFRLLTRQEPQNAQAWLWLAGVAENRAERQAALEHVVELEPNNEMALKGLQALGVRPATNLGTTGATETPSPPLPVTPPPAAEPARSPAVSNDDDPFAELDALSDVFSSDPGAVRRSDEPARAYDEFDDLSDAMAAAPPPARPARPARGDELPPPKGSSRPAPSRTPPGRRPSARSRLDEDEATTVPARRGINPVLLGLAAVALIALLVLLAWNQFFGEANEPVVVVPPQDQTAAAQATTESGLAPTTAPGAEVTTEPGTEATVVPGAEATTEPGAEATVVPGTEATTEPGAEATAAPAPIDVTGANPQVVAANTPLESQGWLYDFNRPNYAAPIPGNLGQYQPQGRFVVVLLFVVNRTGQPQPIPPDFFVLKDAQGRVYEALPEVSSAYVIPGVNADLNHTQPIPADGLTRSVALIFDVAPDATNLVLFARSNTQQGWLVLPGV